MSTWGTVSRAMLHVLHLVLHSPCGVGEGSTAVEAVKGCVKNEVAGDTVGSVPDR